MNFKLAWKNVQKSIKDYAIYFLTLTFAVCIFYAFNSIGAQGRLEGISSNNKALIEGMSTLIGYISVFVSIVLGCLIIYANNFLIKRRKRELGIYMSLGMGKRKISKLIVSEELIIGVASVVCGIISGVILSQFIGILTNKLFQLGVSKFQIIFSFDAMIKSVVYFGIIFILVMIFNVLVISRYKLIDLINSKRKNEKVKIKSPIIAALIFIVAVIIIAIAYKLVLKVGFNPQDIKFKLSIALGVVGTILCFYGITGFTVLILEKIKGIYYKKLNIFTVRQVGSKINTNFISMAVICLMLFFTISLIAVSVGFKSQNVDKYTPVDASIVNITYTKNYPTETALKEKGFKLPEGSNEAILNVRNIEGINTQAVLGKYVVGNQLDYYKKTKIPLSIISLSDYNKYLKLMGKKEETLNKDQILVVSNLPAMSKTIDNITSKGGEIKLLDKEYNIKGDKAIDMSLSTEMSSAYDFVIIANDSLADKGTINRQILNIDYGTNKKQAEEYMNNFFKKGTESLHGSNKDEDALLLVQTKIGAIKGQSDMTSMLLYIAIYIGSIFLIASAAVLALQQLSEASDSMERYKMLREVGASKSQINKSIFKQISVYFGLPLVLAIVHSIVGIQVGNEMLENFGKSNIMEASIITIGFIVIVYFGYFLVTYFGYRNIVKN